MNRNLLIPMASVLFLTACASQTRQGPPAPVVQITPRAPVAAPRPLPPAPPAAPEPRATQVFAYQDPGLAPDPESVHESRIQPPPDAWETGPGASGMAAPMPVTPSSRSAAPADPSSSRVAPPPANVPPASRSAPAAPVATSSRPTPAAPVATPSRPAPAAATPATPARSAPPRPVESAPPPLPTPAPARPSAPPAPETQVAAAAPPAPRAPALAPTNLPPAADALARQAEQQRQSGDYAGAAASLERSLRVAPRDAYLWNRLARVRLEQGQTAQANNMAARANDLAGDNPALKQDNWRVIAEARRRSGDTAGASEAERRASGQ